MKKISPLIVILSLTVLIAVGCATLYVFLYMSLAEMKDKRLAFAGGIRNAESIIAQEDANNMVLSMYFVKDGEQASFVSSIESSCREKGLICDISSLDESAASADSIKILRASISAQGAFSSVLSFLKSFEQSPYPLQISRTTFTSAGADDQWRGTFDIEVPVLISQ